MPVDPRPLLGTLLLLLFSTATATAAPNIVVILTDDQDDTGSMAHMPKTLSLLAERGVTFTNSFVNFSLCAPSRSSLLTGEAAHNDGIRSNKATKGGGWLSFKSGEEDTLPIWLKSAGYNTALLGKYLNGYGKGKPPHQSGIGYWAGAIGKWIEFGGSEASPQDPRTWVPPGWDLWYAFTKVRYYDYSINENGKLLDFGHQANDYSTDVLENRAVRFINDQAGSKAPFFMLIATKAPHGQGDEGERAPAIASPKYDHEFAHIKLPISSAFGEQHVSNQQPVAGILQNQQGKRGDNGATYRAELQSLQSVDDLVEGVVNALQSTGKLYNTVIVYTSDNGFLYGDHGLSAKNSFYEGSIRVTLLGRGPGIPENATRSQLVNNLDVSATVEQLAGVSPGIAPDGHTLSPLFVDADAPWRSALLVEGGDDQTAQAKGYVAVRTASKKYVQHSEGSEELYDLSADPYELQNKADDASYAGDLATLRGIEDRLKSCAGTSCWVP